MATPHSARDPEAAAKTDGDMSFEEALGSLEQLIRGMESDTLPLEDLIESYEQGSQLFKICQSRLDAAEARIELIRKNRNGESVATPFGATGEPDPEKNGELF